MAAVGRLFQDWADMIDTLTLHPLARRKVDRPLGELDAVLDAGSVGSGSGTPIGGGGMQAEPHEDKVCVWMTKEEAQGLLRELDKWPELPKVERDLVNALKELPRTS
jgi:hypothetical protein